MTNINTAKEELKKDVESNLAGTTYSESEKQAYRSGADFGHDIGMLDNESALLEAQELNKVLVSALEFYESKHREYLANGGLFNPELMQLSGDNLQSFFNPALEALKQMRGEG